MPLRARHLLLSLLAAVIGLGVAAPAIGATATSSSGIMITLSDSSGHALPHIFVGIEEQQTDGSWAGPQYGPIETDNVGQLFWSTVSGHKYRFCFEDGDYYDRTWNPTYRYKSACYASAAYDPAAATVITATTSVQNITQVLALDGLSMTGTTPWVTGTPSVGSTLTVVDTGIAAPTDAAISYHWSYWDSASQTEVPIANTSNSYVVTSDMAGKALGVDVTATKSGYATVTLGDSVGVIGGKTPTSATALRITGTVAVGQTLTAAWGAFTPAASTNYGPGYQWFVGGRAVTDDTSSATYVVKAADRGKVISLRAEYYNWDTDMDNAIKGFARTAPVLGVLTAPTPTVSGTVTVGYTLTVKPGTWGPAPVTLSYQWYRYTSAGWAKITGATQATYTLTTADQGKKVLAKVIGAKTGYLTTSKNSAATAAVLGRLGVGTPSVSGTARVGYTLYAHTGTWAPSPVTFHFQWYKVSSTGVVTAISGATGSSYKLTSYQRGYTVKVRVVGSKTGYMSVPRYSAPTAKVY